MAMMRIPDGRNLDLHTQSAEFLAAMPGFIAVQLEGLGAGTLTAPGKTTEEANIQALLLLGCIGTSLGSALPGVTAAEKEAFVALVGQWCGVVVDSTDGSQAGGGAGPNARAGSGWAITGRLPADCQELLDVTTVWARDSRVVKHLFAGKEAGALGSYARLCASCERPGATFCASMLQLVFNLMCNSKEGKRLLVETGMLAQVFRVALLHPAGDAAEAAHEVVRLACEDGRLLRKIIGGTSGGAEGGGHAATAAALNTAVEAARKMPRAAPLPSALLDLGKLLLLTGAPTDAFAAPVHEVQICRFCSKSSTPGGEPLQTCAKCKVRVKLWRGRGQRHARELWVWAKESERGLWQKARTRGAKKV